MSIYTEGLNQLIEVQEIKKAIETKEPVAMIGLSSIHKANLILSLLEDGVKLLIITSTEQQAIEISDDINEMAGKPVSNVFLDKDLNLNENIVVSNENELQRLKTLSNLVFNKIKTVVCSVTAASSYTCMPGETKFKLTVKTGVETSYKELIKRVNDLGYVKRDQVEQIGQYSNRGSIIDIYPMDTEKPVRIDFYGDQVDEIAAFDIDTQKRSRKISELQITRTKEFYIDIEEIKGYNTDEIDVTNYKDRFENLDKYLPIIKNKATIFDYFKNSIVVLSDYKDILEIKNADDKLFKEDLRHLIEDGILEKVSEDYYLSQTKFESKINKNVLYLETFDRDFSDTAIKKKIYLNAQIPVNCGSKVEELANEIKSYLKNHYTILIAGGNEKARNLLINDLADFNVDSTFADVNSKLEKKKVYITENVLTQGIEYPQAKFVYLNRKIDKKFKRVKYFRKGEDINSLSDLKKGDLLVHLVHGIGKFDGVAKLNVQGVVKDYIKIKYSGSDTLYLAVNQFDMVSKYIGMDFERVKLNKLGGNEWKRTQNKVKKSVDDMAKDLIQLYAQRQNTKGFEFSKDNEWMRNFEDHFEYDETEDQLIAIEEIKKDMQSSIPMDRLLCGDVGFGKTEVALRAAFKCVLDSKQVAILCPTTILASQHYTTLQQRIGDFPIKIELLSRFRTNKEQKEIIKKLNSNMIDIIIGTHRLVQKDIQFRDLGLAIIDEEQRFGVAQKEKFKELFKGVDILSLSATPIPRTINMAMSGIRDMSVLETPPEDRQTIQTYVMQYQKDIIASAIRKELRRGGQVYYLHNRIDTIDAAATRVQAMVPNARVKIAHGQMNENTLSKVWQSLIDREIDVLISTTLIETGIDIKNVNTLIVENADKMGLSQLYQLRGRVGRSRAKAYAYFTFFGGKILTEIAQKRLTAIREFTKFGSGFRIALRDLEIRGAGNLLGKKQHGQMEAVGYDMYLKILKNEIKRLQGKKVKNEIENCVVEIPINANIPQDYISSLEMRLDMYRRISAVRTQKEMDQLLNELKDRFSNPPSSVIGLLEISLIRAKAMKNNFTEISMNNNYIRLYNKRIDEKFVQLAKTNLNLNIYYNKVKSYIDVELKDKDIVNTLKELLQLFEKK